MDERDLPKITSGIPRSAAPKEGPPTDEGCSVAFFGDPARVQEGFEIALRAMGIGRFEYEGDSDA